MNKLRLLTRSFWYFRLTNLAVVLGVAVGVSVLGGSLLVGHSTRQSMVAMVDARLGSTDYVLVAPHVFKSSMAQRVMDQAGVKRNIAYLQPILTTTGSASKMDGSEKFEKVTVFGADSSTMLHLFSWGPSGVVHAPLTENILWVGESLAADLGLTYGSSLKIHLDSDPLRTDSGLWGVSEETGLLIGRNNVLVLHENMPEGLFSLGITQHIPKNVWVWTAQLQQALNLEDVANVLGAVAGRGHREEALTAQLQKALAAAVTLEDYGIRLVEADNGEISIESDQLFLPFPVEKAADSLKGATITKVFSYLATTVSDSVTKKEFPYSMIAGVSHLPDGEIADGKIVLNRWAADDLGATPYDTIVVEFPKRGSDGIIRDGSAEFTLDRIISMDGYGGDRTLVPEFKGLTDVNSISDWKPPRDFRFDSSRIRPTDEDYWNKYKAAPKAFINIGTAKTLWETPYGDLTSIRVRGYSKEELEKVLLAEMTPESMGLSFRPIRAEQLAAAEGNTDFSGLFIGFSFFLILSSALLVALLERLSVEQRVTQIGMMSAMGFSKGQIRNLLMAEGVIVLLLGCSLGALGSIGAAWLMILGLKTVWVGAVGTTALSFYVDKTSLIAGCLGGFFVGIVAISRGVVVFRSLPIVGMMRGRIEPEGPCVGRRMISAYVALIAAVAAVSVISAPLWSNAISAPIAFYVGGVLLLCGFLAGFKALIGARAGAGLYSPGPFRFLGLAIRNASRNPTRSMLTVGLLASAVFIISAVGSMKEDARFVGLGKASGTGGYGLIAECDVPVPYDFNSPEGRKYLAIPEEHGLWDGVSVVGMRSTLGDDVSCRNLYRPGNPKVTSVPDSFIKDGAFSFVSSLKDSKNPWELLKEPMKDRTIPVIADSETAQWILHKKLGDIIQVTDEKGRNRDLRIVAMVRKSIFQSELLMSQERFRDLFPSRSGFDTFLIEVPPGSEKGVETVLRESLSDFGVDVGTTQERLGSYFEIANTYISAFEALGGLGMILGGLGLVIVLARGVVERRAELAVLSAIGFRRRTIASLVALENGVLLIFGMAIGMVAAGVSVSPELVRNYGREGWGTLAGRMLPGWMIVLTVVMAIVAMLIVSYAMVRKTSVRSLRVE